MPSPTGSIDGGASPQDLLEYVDYVDYLDQAAGTVLACDHREEDCP